MEPGLRDREYEYEIASYVPRAVAAMEPGLRDREYVHHLDTTILWAVALQWSPVLETGNTRRVSGSWISGDCCNGARS